MMSCRVMWLVLLLVPVMVSTCATEPLFSSPPTNNTNTKSTRWEVLEVTAKHTHIDYGIVIKVKEGYSYHFWDLYKTSSRSQRLGIINKMSENLKRIAYWDSRLDMIGLILFGPERSRKLLRASADKLPEPGDLRDFSDCVETVVFLLGQLCGPVSFESTRHARSIRNMCKLVEKRVIQDAIIMTCGLNTHMESVDDNADAVVARLIKMASFDDTGDIDGIDLPFIKWTIITIACSLVLHYLINYIRATRTLLPREKWTGVWNKAMKDSHLICVLLIFLSTLTAIYLLSRSHRSNQFFESLKRVVDEQENEMRRDVLGAISTPIKERDLYLSSLLEKYQYSSDSIRPTVIEEIRNAVTKIAYLDSRVNLIGWILFGPKEARSVLHSVRDIKTRMVDDRRCLLSTLKLFETHCGALIEQRMMQSLANLCNYVVEKEAIREAIMLACGMQTTESHSIDVANPKVEITPTPIHGTFQYCGRVSVNSISRTKLRTYAKSYQIMVVPSEYIPEDRHKMIRICFHRNASMGLCRCENDDWGHIQKGSWSSVLPSHEQRYVDVKFVIGISGFVTVSLEEAPPAHRDGAMDR